MPQPNKGQSAYAKRQCRRAESVILATGVYNGEFRERFSKRLIFTRGASAQTCRAFCETRTRYIGSTVNLAKHYSLKSTQRPWLKSKVKR